VLQTVRLCSPTARSTSIHFQTAYSALWLHLSSDNLSAWNFWNAVLKKMEDQLERSCDKWKSITKNQKVKERATKRRKASWIGHIMRRNYLIKQVTGEKIKGKYKLGKDEEEEVSSYWITLRRWEDTKKIIEEALDCTPRRTRFGRGCGPVVRQTLWWTSGR